MSSVRSLPGRQLPSRGGRTCSRAAAGCQRFLQRGKREIRGVSKLQQSASSVGLAWLDIDIGTWGTRVVLQQELQLKKPSLGIVLHVHERLGINGEDVQCQYRICAMYNEGACYSLRYM